MSQNPFNGTIVEVYKVKAILEEVREILEKLSSDIARGDGLDCCCICGNIHGHAAECLVTKATSLLTRIQEVLK